MTSALAAAKTHLRDPTRTNLRVAVCGLQHPSRGTDDPKCMTCKHCRKAHRRLLKANDEYRNAIGQGPAT